MHELSVGRYIVNSDDCVCFVLSVEKIKLCLCLADETISISKYHVINRDSVSKKTLLTYSTTFYNCYFIL